MSLRARVLLEEAHRLGIELADLIAVASADAAEPTTLASFVPTVEATFGPGTAATYRPYWRLALQELGDRRVADLTVADITGVVTAAGERARRNRPGTSGRSAEETCIAAFRAVLGRAVSAGAITANPAAAVAKPRRRRSRRRALEDRELRELIDAVRTTSTDPTLDLTLIRLHLETGARRSGALHLRLGDLDPGRSTAWLSEKGDGEREQPVSPSLLALLHHLAHARGDGALTDPVFRLSSGQPISARRYDTVFAKARQALPWTDRTPVSAHVLRHTSITAVARIAGYPVAQAFAGHLPPTVTGRYIHASISEVAQAVADLTGEPHPLAEPRATSTRTTCSRR